MTARPMTLALAVALAAPAAQAKPKPTGPQVVTPEGTGKGKRKRKRGKRGLRDKERDFSEGGARRGGVELGLGTVLLLGSVALIGRGGWEIATGRELERTCREEEEPKDPECFSNRAPSFGHRIAAGLSFGFAIPMAIAGGLLTAYGARIHRDYKKHRSVTAMATGWAGPRGAGVGLRLRF